MKCEVCGKGHKNIPAHLVEEHPNLIVEDPEKAMDILAQAPDEDLAEAFDMVDGKCRRETQKALFLKAELHRRKRRA